MTSFSLIIRVKVLNIKTYAKFKLIFEYMLQTDKKDFNFNDCLCSIFNKIMLTKESKS